MGRILQTFGLQTKPILEAQSAPQVLGEYSPYAMPFQYAYVSREEALAFLHYNDAAIYLQAQSAQSH
jgi:hypothetical protein